PSPQHVATLRMSSLGADTSRYPAERGGDCFGRRSCAKHRAAGDTHRGRTARAATPPPPPPPAVTRRC
ncbi:hypothetical protein EMIHUDRAFT_368195, partial [Emiliania huxleyi CCMP1516]|uniref:Uncharacterized protein n=2 Tax=Emiliania huxleyi TaxID=2903 RepID=A0A0D3JIJ9_EMIH1